jgi:hypothetical protein
MEVKNKMPEGYESWDACIAANQDKADPAAYCATICHRPGESANSKLPRMLFLFAESMKLDGNKVSGVAIHPKKLWHPEEGMVHNFLEDELQKNLKMQSQVVPFGIDHLQLLPKPNLTESLWWAEQEKGVAFKGTVDDERAKLIREGKFKGLSIELNWLRPGVMMERMEDGSIAPRNFDITAIHFMQRFPPADKDTYVKLWEGITITKPFEAQVEDISKSIGDAIKEGKVEKLNELLPQLATLKEVRAGEINVVQKQMKDATDSAVKEKLHFAESSKKLDELRESIAKAPINETESIVKLRKELNTAKALAEGLKTEKNELEVAAQTKHNVLRGKVLEAIPPPQIWKSWKGAGAKLMIQQLLHALDVKPVEYES